MGYLIVSTFDNRHAAEVEKAAQEQNGHTAEIKVSGSVTVNDSTVTTAQMRWDKDGAPTLYTVIIEGGQD
jgi:uncharacterized surface protein with fasciclin (FAS1) repeats